MRKLRLWRVPRSALLNYILGAPPVSCFQGPLVHIRSVPTVVRFFNFFYFYFRLYRSLHIRYKIVITVLNYLLIYFCLQLYNNYSVRVMRVYRRVCGGASVLMSVADVFCYLELCYCTRLALSCCSIGQEHYTTLRARLSVTYLCRKPVLGVWHYTYCL